ncbi:unnamed protein product [Pleuronectes platessa]|uniref:Uncharacterized protein n=1 Tax=Pleuronectes platessa TaxID=8262 RepID=A0A9N7VXY9_PLEPL|nr:unnamed protein product [Pleuronectes platessa]
MPRTSKPLGPVSIRTHQLSFIMKLALGLGCRFCWWSRAEPNVSARLTEASYHGCCLFTGAQITAPSAAWTEQGPRHVTGLMAPGKETERRGVKGHGARCSNPSV